MRNVLQEKLREMEKENPSLNEHPQNIVRILIGKAKILYETIKGVEKILQVEHIYSTDKDENSKICYNLKRKQNDLDLIDDLVYHIRGPKAIEEAIQLREEIRKQKTPYQVHAEANMQFSQ